MTTVLSKLRDLSDRTGVPYNHLTRALSGAVVTLFAAKLSYPYVRKYILETEDETVELRTKSKKYTTNEYNNKSCKTHIKITSKPDNDQMLGLEENPNDVLLKIVHHYEDGTLKRDLRSPSERYLTFGPERSNVILAKIEELLVRLLYEIRHLTGFNVDFVIQMIKLIRIMVPNLASREVLLLVMHTISLISRTFLSIYVANLDGQVVKQIVRRDLVQFVTLMSKWLLIAVPATFLNSLIRFLESKLALAFRTRLVKYAYNQYFNNETYYSVSNLDGRLENVDHSLTDDITTFAGHCAHLYSSVTKPLLDVSMILLTLFTMSRQMGSYGMSGPLLGTTIVFCTHLILRKCSPQFGRLVSEEARHKGFLRSVHARVITNAEEIAFYRGGEIEQTVLERAYASLVKQMNVISNQKLWYIMLEQMLMKYLWSATGMVLIAAPIMLTSSKKRVKLLAEENKLEVEGLQAILTTDDISDRTQYMMTAKNILMSSSDALERLLSSYKELIELVGYTNRVSKMFTVFEQVGRGQYKRVNVVKSGSESPQSSSPKLNKSKSELPVIALKNGVPEPKGIVSEGKDFIRLVNVPVVTPNCDVVVPCLSFMITNDMHLLITGPNGCGKSSLFRILAGLWPVFNGILERPHTRDMFYIPQRPYMSIGTLREQLIYPDSVEEMHSKGYTDAYLADILDSVKLKDVVKREGGWDAKADWKDILSGGEKQRLGMARLFYHRPQFALLDECTSAVSIDIEGEMYERAKLFGINLITITHRPSLWKFHTHLLQFDGEGGWRLEPLDATSRLTLKEQKDQLERELSELPSKQQQLQQLCNLLGEDSHLISKVDQQSPCSSRNLSPKVDSSTSAIGNAVTASVEEEYHSLELYDEHQNLIDSTNIKLIEKSITMQTNGHVQFSDNIQVNS